MQYRYVALFILACTFATLCPLRTFGQGLPAVVLSEIQWGGSSLSTADEWIELTSTSDRAIDISGWTIAGVGSSDALITLPPGSILGTQTTYVIANYASGDAHSVLAFPPSLVTTTVSIPNTNLSVTLFDAGGTPVDTYIDAGTPDVGSSSPHVAMERNLLDGSWFSSSDSVGLRTSDTRGTPGFAVFPLAPEVLAPPSVTAAANDDIVEAPTVDASSPTPEAGNGNVENVPLPDIPPEISVLTSDEPLPLVEYLDEVPTADGTDTIAEDTTNTPPSLLETSEETPEIITLIAPVSLVSVIDADTQASPPVSDEHSATEHAQEHSLHRVVTVTLDYTPLRFNEFLSSPSDGSEWVELWNTGEAELDLSHVTLRDASGKQTMLSETIAAQGYILIENPAGKLNNAGDTLSLLLSDGQLLTTLTYGTDTFAAPKKGFAAGACADGWRTTLVPTPGAPNTCPTTSLESSLYVSETSTTSSLDVGSTDSGNSSADQGDFSSSEDSDPSGTSFAPVAPLVVSAATPDIEDAAPADEGTPAKKTAKTSTKKTSQTTVVDVALADLDALSSGQHVRVSGVIVAAPGPFGKRVAYLDGVQLYFYKADWPELVPGTQVTVTGTWDTANGQRRIKISSAPDIAVTGTSNPAPVSYADALTAGANDMLTTATGTFTRKEGEVFVCTLADGSAFYVRDTAKTGALSGIRAGDAVTIVGMLFAEDGILTLVPRDASDVQITSSSIPSPSSLASITATTLPSSLSDSSSATPLVGGGILASTVSALGYWLVRSRKFSFLSH